MKKLPVPAAKKSIIQIIGIAIAAVAIYFSLKGVDSDEFFTTLSQMEVVWIIPIIIGNFIVIATKALRWRIILAPVKKIRFLIMYNVLLIGFMANNILPARMGEAVRIYILGKDALISKLTATATLIADKFVESVSFLLIAFVMAFFTDIPEWLYAGLITVLVLTSLFYIFTIIYSTKRLKNKFLIRFQDGIRPLLNLKILSGSMVTSILSWLLQGALLYLTQIAFDIHIPIWGIILVLVSVNLAIAIPSAPAHIGTFEFAAVVAYSYLGVDKSTALLIALIYHSLQVFPVTLAGGLVIFIKSILKPKEVKPPDYDVLSQKQ